MAEQAIIDGSQLKLHCAVGMVNNKALLEVWDENYKYNLCIVKLVCSMLHNWVPT